MKKWNKDAIKNFWREHKVEIICVGGGAIITAISVVAARSTLKKLEMDHTKLLNSVALNLDPTRIIPETEGFKILDIGEDINDGCIVWLDGCKLSDCGKLGEGLTTIERVTPNMMVTMAILGKENLEL